MKQKILEMINKNFSESNKIDAMNIIESVTLKHVMANCENNLLNTHMAMIKIANGDMVKLKEASELAKNDFRDVIVWASEIK